MQNELLYIIHIFLILSSVVGAFLCGRAVLSAFVYLLVACANLFVAKKILLVGMSASGSDMYIVGSMCGILLLQEEWGEAYAFSVLRMSFVMAGVLLVLSWFQCWYIPLAVDWAGPLFDQLLGVVPRVTLASIVAHGVAQVSALSIQKLLGSMRLYRWIIAAGALCVGQVVDSILFFVGTFYGSESLSIIGEMVMMSVAMKIVAIIGGSFVVGSARRLQRWLYA